jgi:hypothetical protein
MGGFDRGGAQKAILVWQYESDGKRRQTVKEVGRPLGAMSLGNDVENFPDIHPAHEEMEIARVGFLDERFDGACGGLVKQPDDSSPRRQRPWSRALSLAISAARSLVKSSRRSASPRNMPRIVCQSGWFRTNRFKTIAWP